MCRFANSTCSFARDVIKMRCVAADHNTEGDHSVKIACFRGLETRERQLECTRHVECLYRIFARSDARQGVHSSVGKFRCQRVIPLADDYRETKARGRNVPSI